MEFKREVSLIGSFWEFVRNSNSCLPAKQPLFLKVCMQHPTVQASTMAWEPQQRTTKQLHFVPIILGFCGICLARLTSPSCIIRCVTSIFPAAPPNPPYTSQLSSYLVFKMAGSGVGKRTSARIRWLVSWLFV